MIRKIDIPFENQMTGTQTVLGWLYLAVHVAALPLLLGVLEESVKGKPETVMSVKEPLPQTTMEPSTP